jgi:hypothetical protein
MTAMRFRVYIPVILVAFAASIVLGTGCAPNAGNEPTLAKSASEFLTDAAEADFANDLELTRTILLRAVAAEGPADDIAEAERRLARLAWKYHLEFEEAVGWLEKATSRGVDLFETWCERVRLELKRGDFDAARWAAVQAGTGAETRSQRQAARAVLAEVVVEEATVRRLEGKPIDDGLIEQALEVLSDLVQAEPGDLGPSRLLVAVALLRDDPPAVIEGWRSFYHVAPGSPAPNQVAEAGLSLERLMATWQGAESSAESRAAVVVALADSRFFTEAALVALDPRPSDPLQVRDLPAVQQIVAYARFCRNVEALGNEYYRHTSLGTRAYADFERGLESEARTLWDSLVEPTRSPPTRGFETALNEELGPRFGTEYLMERGSGYRNIRMGHRVIDETRVIEQYGHRAELRFVSLGSMVSNGFRSWAWNGGAQAGGWARNPKITQVRPAYASNPTTAWRQATDEEEKTKLGEEIDRSSVRDQQRARDDPYAYLPGLALRLRRQGRERLLEKLSISGLEGEALRLAFLAEYERVTVESSIFAHEGRHAIHKARRGFLPARSAEKEFRAKLSEVAFAPEPRLSLGAIFNADIGNDSGHGQANERIMRGLVAWMQEHGSEIAGFDPALPLLPQFDLLTDEQIRTAFRSMDPLVT